MKRKNSFDIPIDDNDVMSITPLGAGNEVGRSCILLQFKGKTLMLDCGFHPGYSGLSSLPYFDEIDPSEVDVVLITHFHLDHAAALPFFLEKTSFNGRVFMTHPTKAIYKWLLSDLVKISNVSVDEMLYTEQDVLNSYEKIEVIDYHQQVELEGIKFTGFNAGHVLGAAMFLIEIAGVKVLYTGDYSREEDRHLMAAERPPVQPDVLICESTYGVQSHEPRLDRESRFTGLVQDIVQRDGRCLIPVFALGGAQELLLILDEYWQAHPELHNIPIYYASSLAKKCMAVYQTYINMMNQKIRKQFAISNPFIFKHVSNLKNVDNFDDVGPCVMMASPGFLQSGLSRELLERWCTDKRNGVIIPGYVVDGTLAKTLLSEPDEITSLSGAKLPMRMSIDYISFSAHVDYSQNSKFIDEVNAPHLILVHGNANEMGRLRSALQSKFLEREQNVKIYCPKNCETVQLYFRGEKMAKTIGRLAASEPVDEHIVQGLLVSKDFRYHIMDPSDISQFTDLQTSVIYQRQRVNYQGSYSLLKFHIQQMFGVIDDLEDENKHTFRVFDTVDVIWNELGEVTLEWEGNSMNDAIADSVLAVLLQIESSPVSLRMSKSKYSCCQKKEESRPKEFDVELWKDFLQQHFEQVEVEPVSNVIRVQLGDHSAELSMTKNLEIEAQHDDVRNRLQSIVSRVKRTLFPISTLNEA